MRALVVVVVAAFAPACAGEGSCFEIPGDGCDEGGGGGGGGGSSPPSYTYSYVGATARDGEVLVAVTAERVSLSELQLRRVDAAGSAVVWDSGYGAGGTFAMAAAPAQVAIAEFDTLWLVDDERGVAVSAYLPSGGWAFEPAVAFDGRVWIVAWEVTSTGAEWARVTPEGEVVDAEPVAFAPPTPEGWAGAYDPRVLAMPGGSLLIWRAPGAGLRAARMASGGELLDTEPLALVDELRVVLGAAARAGEALLLLENRSNEPATLEGALIDFATGATKTWPLTDVPSQPIAGEDDVTLAAGADGYLVAWRTFDGIVARRLDANGAWLGGASLVIPGWTAASIAPAVAWNGAEYVVVAGNIPDYRGLASARVAADGATTAPELITPDPYGAGGCAVAPARGSPWTLVPLAFLLALRRRRPAGSPRPAAGRVHSAPDGAP